MANLTIRPPAAPVYTPEQSEGVQIYLTWLRARQVYFSRKYIESTELDCILEHHDYEYLGQHKSPAEFAEAHYVRQLDHNTLPSEIYDAIDWEKVYESIPPERGIVHKIVDGSYHFFRINYRR